MSYCGEERRRNGLDRAVPASVSNTGVRALEHGLVGRKLAGVLRRAENGRRAYTMERHAGLEDKRSCEHSDLVESGSCDG